MSDHRLLVFDRLELMNFVEHRDTVDERAHFVMQQLEEAYTCLVVVDLTLDCCSMVE